MTRRQSIVEAVAIALAEIKSDNGFNTDFNRITYWQDTDTQYGFNHLNYRDTTEEYSRKNQVTDAQLNIEIVAVVYGSQIEEAALSGTLVLTDLIEVVKTLSKPNCLFDLARSHKWVETKGKTACCVELELTVKYKF